ncbi:MAG: serine/threonine-protein kinase RsbW [Actinomycetota bacterium]|nr:serine/threonine-protein kinase RsbW [Actinomycetota bacterium]
MVITFNLCLPRDELSVPVVRHLCRDALIELGVRDHCVSDVELAVTEACTNVVRHAAGTHDVYEVAVVMDPPTCSIKITDLGIGVDQGDLSREAAAHDEGGRGIFLMRALVDDLQFVSKPEQGTLVKLEKKLSFVEGAIAARLTTASS